VLSALKDGDVPAEMGGVWRRLGTRLVTRWWMGRRRRRLNHGERKLIERRTTALLRDPHALGQVGGVTAVCCLVELLLLPGAPGYRGFLAGALAASVPWMIQFKLWQATWRETRGVEAEARSGELVSSVPQWLVVNDLFVQGRNIDHVVVTPLAVLAVETTWWGEASPEVHRGRRQGAVDQARKNAGTLKLLLRSVGFDLPVWPVVVAWGPGADPTQLGRVDVVAGEDACSWIAAYQNGAIHGDLAERAHAALLAYQAKNDEYRERTDPGRVRVAA
jgi:nuclease-like protein